MILTASFLKFLEWLMTQIALLIINFEHVTFLPVEKRRLHPYAQKRLGEALSRLSQSHVLLQQAALRKKLWVLGLILQDDKIPSIVPIEWFQNCKPEQE